MNEHKDVSTELVSGFALYLSTSANLLDSKTSIEASQNAALENISFIQYLINQKLVNGALLAQAAAEYYGLPFFDIDQIKPDVIPKEYLNIELVANYLALPIYKKNNVVYIATIDPSIEHLEDISFLTGCMIRLIIVEPSKLTRFIDNTLGKKALTDVSNTIDTMLGSDLTKVSRDKKIDEINSMPVVKYINSLLRNAIDKKASDIHFESFEHIYRIRFRIDGILHLMVEPPANLSRYLLSRLKIMANLDITEQRLPQDGRFKFNLDDSRSFDFRISTLPTMHGEKVVLRILNTSEKFEGIEQLGMLPVQRGQLLLALKHTQGIILVTGPTGSGKTVTLYSSLSFLNSMEKNILTVEDPVEIPLLGINQVHVNPKIGLTFANALRSFLRQDPDIIMVGEIRDLETAEIAVRAAQTGHLVLSTLHTNNAVEAVTRLMNLGIAPYNLSSSLILLIAQRLVRVLCSKCKKKADYPEDVLLKEGFTKEELSSLELYAPSSCELCTNGYRGRTGIFEVLPITEEIANTIVHGKESLKSIESIEQMGVMSLRQAGRQKVRDGITSLAEIDRVLF